MPGADHEAIVELLRERPELLRALLAATGATVPAGAVSALDSDLSARRPLTLLADAVFWPGKATTAWR